MVLSVGMDRDDPLGALRWHWGEAYDICNPEPDVWLAVRRDDHATLRDETPTGLRDRILADYFARPVPRQDHGGEAGALAAEADQRDDPQDQRPASGEPPALDDGRAYRQRQRSRRSRRYRD
jgi:hypothetical protein